jgi:hypothetical protein
VPGRSHFESDEEVLTAVAQHPDPVIVAKDLLPYLSYHSDDGIRNRLNELSENGLLHKRSVGARAVVYWLSDDGREMIRRD